MSDEREPTPPDGPAPRPAPLRSRLTCVTEVSYQAGEEEDSEDHSVHCSYDQGLEDDGCLGPHPSRIRLEQEWTKLPTGHVVECALIVVEVSSFPPEKLVTEDDVVEISFASANSFASLHPCVLVRPGRCAMFEPNHLEIWLRARSGKLRCTVTLFPV